MSIIIIIKKLRDRGYSLHDAIVFAGATRFRPIMLGALTTASGLIPIATSISFDIRAMSMSFVSETSQYWKNLSYMIIFGLPLGTVLTLVVVPTIYSIIETAPVTIRTAYGKIKKWYWKPFEKESADIPS